MIQAQLWNMNEFLILVRLFELMLYVPVNSNGHVGTLPQFYGTLGYNDTQNLLHKYNHPTKPIRLVCMDDLTKPLFLGRLRHERLTSNQISHILSDI